MAIYKSDLTRLSFEMPDAGERALLETAVTVLATADQLVPVDEGLLKESGGIEVVSPEHINVGYGREGSQREDVAIYQEFGTVNMPAQPYLGPAFEQNVETFEDRVLSHVKRVIK